MGETGYKTVIFNKDIAGNYRSIQWYDVCYVVTPSGDVTTKTTSDVIEGSVIGKMATRPIRTRNSLWQ